MHNTKRIIVFDYLRALAIMGIIVCHFCFNFSEMVWFGKWCGDTFNFMFLMISAILLGLAWNRIGRPRYGIDFLKHRFIKLSSSYYPFLIFMFIFCMLAGGFSISMRDVVMHLLYLPWFDKIPGFGHLWFMTMISICYFGVFVVSWIKIDFGRYKLFVYLCLIGLSLIAMHFLDKVGLPGYMPLYLMAFVVLFLEADTVMRIVTYRNWNVTCLCVAVLASSLYSAKCASVSDEVLKLSGMATSLSLFELVMVGLYKVKENKVVSFVAGISYEMYLVHHLFAYGRFSVMEVTPYWCLGFLLLLTASIILAWLLNKIGRYVLYVLNSYCF